MNTTPLARLAGVRLAHGVSRINATCYLWAAFVSIGIFAYGTALQPYILSVNLHIPPEKRGVLSGDLQFWQEVIALFVFAVIGAWADRTGRRVVYVTGFLVAALAYALYPFAENYPQLLLYRLIFAIGVATLGGMLQIVLADYPAESDRGKLAGFATFLNSLGALLFLTLLTRLPAVFSDAGVSDLWAGRLSYLLGACICVLSAFVMLGLRPGRPEAVRAQTPLTTLIAQGVAAARQPRIALAYASAFASRADLVIVALFLSLWAQSDALADGFSPTEAAKKQGMLFAMVQGCALLWAPVFGWLADRMNRVTLVVIAIVLSIVGYGWIGLIEHPLETGAIPAAIMLGIGQTSGVLATQVLVGQEAPGAFRGAVVGTVGFCGAFGILVISKIGGYAYDHWMPGAPFVIMAFANAALLLFAVYVRVRAPGPMGAP